MGLKHDDNDDGDDDDVLACFKLLQAGHRKILPFAL